ncbi:hypothetical protein SO802_001855 [Lithocarpus litseifolius]|uniref:Uncharacterized protein n=1 Tax=Lithocarpus litseifolius TaxID=425828 RepID=A0AAW2DWJ0_9ROSI
MGESIIVGFDVRIRWWMGRPVDGSVMGGWVSGGNGWVGGSSGWRDFFKSSSLIIHSQIPLKTPTDCAEMVETTAKRGLFVAVLFMFVILLHLNYCGAAASLNINTTITSSSVDGPVDDSEFMFDSQISRMLVNYEFVYGTDSAGNKNKAFCSRNPYKNCLPQSNGQRVPETCDKYKRRGC